MRFIGLAAPASAVKTEISRATQYRRDLGLVTICLFVIGLFIFTEWQRQVNTFHLSIQEYAQSLERK
jgi:hypothetical protein